MVKITALTDILKNIEKQKNVIIKSRETTNKLGVSNQALEKAYDKKLKALDKEYNKVFYGTKLPGFKDNIQAKEKFIAYRKLVSKQNEIFNEKQMNALASVSDGGQIVEHIFKVGNVEEIRKAKEFQDKYLDNSLTKKQLDNEIARLRSRQKRDVYENRNTKVKIKRALHENFERQWIDQNEANGYVRRTGKNSFEITREGLRHNISDKWKNIQKSYKELSPDEYTTYYAKKTGRDGKYIEGLEYDLPTGRDVKSGETTITF